MSTLNCNIEGVSVPSPRNCARMVSWEDNETEEFRMLCSSGPDHVFVRHPDGNCANAETTFLHDIAGTVVIGHPMANSESGL